MKTDSSNSHSSHIRFECILQLSYGRFLAGQGIARLLHESERAGSSV
jgi:hypothetical protein